MATFAFQPWRGFRSDSPSTASHNALLSGAVLFLHCFQRALSQAHSPGPGSGACLRPAHAIVGPGQLLGDHPGVPAVTACCAPT
ncbi:hypothetical protein VTO73DRAFT_13293 [Trametes versicolor]